MGDEAFEEPPATDKSDSSIERAGSVLSETRRSRGYGVVLVDQAAEHVVAPDVKVRDRGTG
jgi:hypothetical protein